MGIKIELIVPVCRPGVELAALLDKMREQSLRPESIHLLVTADEEEFREICERYMRFWEECGKGQRGIESGSNAAHEAKATAAGEAETVAKIEMEAAAKDAGETAAEKAAEKAAGREERTADKAEMPALRFTRIAPEEFDHGGTRHRGAGESRADVLLFMTQDAVPADAYLVENLARALEGADETVVAAAYARQLPGKEGDPIERFTRGFNYPAESMVKTAADLPRLGIKTFFCSNACAAYRRDIYEKQGGFLRRTIFNEDMIFAAGLVAAGYGVAYAADARVVHSHSYSGWQQIRRNFDLAVSQADHPEVFEGIASEGEGIRLVKRTAADLCGSGRIYLLPKLLWQSACKYLGYLLGKHYRRLPRALVLAITMNKRYWSHEKEV